MVGVIDGRSNRRRRTEMPLGSTFAKGGVAREDITKHAGLMLGCRHHDIPLVKLFQSQTLCNLEEWSMT